MLYNNLLRGIIDRRRSAPGVWTGDLVSTGVHTREHACLKVENNYLKIMIKRYITI
jgi:hypothetical protein